MIPALRLFDIHAHLADPRVRPGLKELLPRCREHGVNGVLVNAARRQEWEFVIQLATEPGLSGALGLHPFFADEWEDDLPAELERLILSHPRIMAVGEIGLDFYDHRDSRERQIAIFTAQLAVARRLHRPVILHNRKSWPEFFGIWKALGAGALTGVCHHFTGSLEIARQALDLGLYLSFCGPLTYPHSRRIKAAAAFCPLDRILTETDAPDLPAAPFPGGPSEPWHVRFIVEEIARLKNLPETTVAAQIEANYRWVLNLPAEN